ncbi:MAG: pentapeptide repeat-containing protein [Alphaproteobacteria bacterium]|nr:pentapeptide repeat-containing protein [Alphaproteobacteria bacterium]MDA8005404.1 pentapeptide repeat-containing protein [Alphaproteobacteria bacterium]MDA8012903.1 pentapeptide repeat-containing protein [Alphaproteobacteria bacterium]
MSEKRSGEREGKRVRGWPHFCSVGLLVFVIGFVFWTFSPWLISITFLSSDLSLKLFWNRHSEAYLPGLILLGLAGLTAGFTYWRGQQTNQQIKETQRQIKEAQRQTREQSFNNAIQMAVDVRDPARAVAGWWLLLLWLEREDPADEDKSRYLEMACSTATGVLSLKSETESMLRDGLEKLRKHLEGRTTKEGMVRYNDYFREANATRVDTDVRQQAFNLLIEHPSQKWVAEKVWVMNFRDLTDLFLGEDMLRQCDPKGEWRFVAVSSHCIGAHFQWRINLSGANFSDAKMMGAYLEEANLSGAILRGADLRRAELTGANLREAKLPCANLQGNNLWDSTLEGADLSWADLRKAILYRRLPSWNKPGAWENHFVRFHRTRIDGTDFTDIEDASTYDLKALLKGCWWSREIRDGRPHLPEGIDADDIPDSPDKTVPTGGEEWG